MVTFNEINCHVADFFILSSDFFCDKLSLVIFDDCLLDFLKTFKLSEVSSRASIFCFASSQKLTKFQVVCKYDLMIIVLQILNSSER